MKKKIGIRYISHIQTKYLIEARGEKEQLRVTSTATPAEDKEEEEAKDDKKKKKKKERATTK